MILLRDRILDALHKGEIVIDPFDEKQLGPNSCNLRLHKDLLIYDEVILDAKRDNRTKRISIPESGYRLDPGQLYLGRTVEKTITHRYIPLLEGRSSIGRLGMAVHISAGFGDIGFNGYWTLEITTVLPLVIYPNMEICQIYYNDCAGDKSVHKYEGKYQQNEEVQASKLFLDFEGKKFKRGDKVRVIANRAEGFIHTWSGRYYSVAFPIRDTLAYTFIPYAEKELELVKDNPS
jgi:dCTP deaminase